MRYAQARYAAAQREYLSTCYIADRLMQIGKNAAAYYGGDYTTKRLLELFEVKRAEKEPDAEEIVADVVKRGGLVLDEPA